MNAPLRPEHLMAQWMIQHNEAPSGKHWRGSVHRRFALARHRHTHGKSCDKRDPATVLRGKTT